MRTTRLITFIAILIISLISCKKEDPVIPTDLDTWGKPDERIYASWEVISGWGNIKYLTINPDNEWILLSEDALKIRQVQTGLALLTPTQIILAGIHNYSISGDTLKLTSPGQSIALLKTQNKPDPETWISYITISSFTEVTAISDGRQDIGFDGTHILWTRDANSSKIYKIDPSTETIVADLDLTKNYYYGQIEFANDHIWISNQNFIEKLNPLTAEVLQTSPELTSTSPLKGISFVENDIWFIDWIGNIKTWNTTNNEINDIALIQQSSGMAFHGEFLYLVHNGITRNIIKYQLSPFQAVKSYQIQGTDFNFIHGLTYDGNSFWTVGYNNTSNTYRLVKLEGI